MSVMSVTFYYVHLKRGLRTEWQFSSFLLSQVKHFWLWWLRYGLTQVMPFSTSSQFSWFVLGWGLLMPWFHPKSSSSEAPTNSWIGFVQQCSQGFCYSFSTSSKNAWIQHFEKQASWEIFMWFILYGGSMIVFWTSDSQQSSPWLWSTTELKWTPKRQSKSSENIWFTSASHARCVICLLNLGFLFDMPHCLNHQLITSTKNIIVTLFVVFK